MQKFWDFGKVNCDANRWIDELNMKGPGRVQGFFFCLELARYYREGGLAPERTFLS
jgi:hypothetical protein